MDLETTLLFLKSQTEQYNLEEINVLRICYSKYHKIDYQCDICKSTKFAKFSEFMDHLFREHRRLLFTRSNNWGSLSLYRYDLEQIGNINQARDYFKSRRPKASIYFTMDFKLGYECDMCKRYNFDELEEVLTHFYKVHPDSFDFKQRWINIIVNIEDVNNLKKGAYRNRFNKVSSSTAGLSLENESRKLDSLDSVRGKSGHFGKRDEGGNIYDISSKGKNFDNNFIKPKEMGISDTKKGEYEGLLSSDHMKFAFKDDKFLFKKEESYRSKSFGEFREKEQSRFLENCSSSPLMQSHEKQIFSQSTKIEKDPLIKSRHSDSQLGSRNFGYSYNGRPSQLDENTENKSTIRMNSRHPSHFEKESVTQPRKSPEASFSNYIQKCLPEKRSHPVGGFDFLNIQDGRFNAKLSQSHKEKNSPQISRTTPDEGIQSKRMKISNTEESCTGICKDSSTLEQYGQKNNIEIPEFTEEFIASQMNRNAKDNVIFPDEENILTVIKLKYNFFYPVDYQCIICTFKTNKLKPMLLHLNVEHKVFAEPKSGIENFYIYSEDISTRDQNFRAKLETWRKVFEYRKKSKEVLRGIVGRHDVKLPKAIRCHGDWIEIGILYLNRKKMQITCRCDVCYEEDLDDIESFMKHMFHEHQHCLSYEISNQANKTRKTGILILALENKTNYQLNSQNRLKESRKFMEQLKSKKLKRRKN